MVGLAFELSEIPKGTYACQKENEPAIRTLATRAMLVTPEELEERFDVEIITQAIFDGAGYLNIESGEMSRKLPSIPLHSAARKYYLEAGYLPSKTVDWLTPTWRSLAIIFMVVGGFNGLVILRRNRVSKFETRKVHEVSVETAKQDSVRKLLDIRTRIQ